MDAPMILRACKSHTNAWFHWSEDCRM